MLSFEDVYHRAVEHKGSVQELNLLLPEDADPQAVVAVDESRFLAEMTRCIFQAGFSWKVIQQKWDGFEDVFQGFEINALLGLLPEDWDEIKQDARIVRNAQKISSVRVNAQFIEDVAIEQGSFARFIADWPVSDLVGLFDLLKKRGSRLGGNSGQRFLRNVGKDTFVLTRDVIRCLQNSGLDIKQNPSSKRDHEAIQNTFNQWHKESGLSYTHMSKIAAYSISS
ncbi:3-methyl-adenine DNA glycosylase I [Mariprofundus micogutta]|uniref:3-methyl-adenine DNA glycosylase I n=1 Tax=Mariprofundus micogutta TaxID=1921010 RepID=A0A1L8CKB9_9PROT|nr:DNA-3-methyladenine glycosylase I [Mariprofundus micogutta]GAV19325.1 3-methyl-adenine DNA glycosylase I [Mariprofundus micogutta]